MPIDKIIAAILLIGSDLPAFKALFEEVLATFHEDDQAKLRAIYEAAVVDADKAHAAAQAVKEER